MTPVVTLKGAGNGVMCGMIPQKLHHTGFILQFFPGENTFFIFFPIPTNRSQDLSPTRYSISLYGHFPKRYSKKKDQVDI